MKNYKILNYFVDFNYISKFIDILIYENNNILVLLFLFEKYLLLSNFIISLIII